MGLSEEQIEHDMRQAAFTQNHLAFRSLNQQMWQIPLIAMTLTGGLWFGVLRVEEFPLFQLALLFLAVAGNVALFFIILRLRFVMEQHLLWLENVYPAGYVSAKGKCLIPDDHISPRRSALFMARSVLRDIRDGAQAC